MKPFSNNQTKRRTALVAMLVWLFALASGMANDCLLEAPGTHAHSTTKPGYAETAHGAASSTDDAMADHGHDDDAGSAKQACLKTCDDGANAPVRLKANFVLSDPGQAPFVAIAWNAETPAVSAPVRRYDLKSLIVQPSFRVRYSRLAL